MKSERNLEVSSSERSPRFSKLRELARTALTGIRNSFAGDTLKDAVGYVILDGEMVYDRKTAVMLGLPTANDENGKELSTSSLSLGEAKTYLEANRVELDGVYASSGMSASALESPMGMVGSGTSFDDMVNAQRWHVNAVLSEIEKYLEPTDS